MMIVALWMGGQYVGPICTPWFNRLAECVTYKVVPEGEKLLVVMCALVLSALVIGLLGKMPGWATTTPFVLLYEQPEASACCTAIGWRIESPGGSCLCRSCWSCCRMAVGSSAGIGSPYFPCEKAFLVSNSRRIQWMVCHTAICPFWSKSCRL